MEGRGDFRLAFAFQEEFFMFSLLNFDREVLEDGLFFLRT